MNVTCNIKIDFDKDDRVDKVLKAIEVDNFDFVDAKKNGKQLVAVINSNSVSSMLHTIDDFLSCVSVAEKIVE